MLIQKQYNINITENLENDATVFFIVEEIVATWTVATAAADTGIHNKILRPTSYNIRSSGSGVTLVILNEEINMKTVMSLEDSGLLIKCVSESFKLQQNNRKITLLASRIISVLSTPNCSTWFITLLFVTCDGFVKLLLKAFTTKMLVKSKLNSIESIILEGIQETNISE